MLATAVDYGRQEIRDRQFEIIEEVCRNYDVDGFELDFMRNPVLFRPTLDGEPCGQEHLDLMTGFMRRLRGMAEAVGRERGKPLLIACRLPSPVDGCLKIGIDIEQWLANDLIDIVVSSLEIDPFTGPVHELVELGHRYGAPVYACLASGQFSFLMLDSMDGWAAAATSAWNAGVDGVYTFNHFAPSSAVWRVIGDPEVLAGMDKVFAVDNLEGSARTKEHVHPRAGRLPAEMALGEPLSIPLPVGDDVAARARGGQLRQLALRVFVDRLTFADEVEYRLNDHVLDMGVVYATDGVSPVACGNFMLRARPDPATVKQGPNEFTALLRTRCESAPGTPSISGLQLVVKYRH